MNLQGALDDFLAGSKVVDAAAAPLMVYHGTSAAFTDFDKKKQAMMPRFWGRPGFFFTNSPREAEANAEWAVIYRQGHANIIPVYLRLVNPVVRKAQGFPQKWFDANWRALMAQAERNGNDGFIVNGSGPGEGRVTYIVFEPAQIVSAIAVRAWKVPATPASLPDANGSTNTNAAPRRRSRP